MDSTCETVKDCSFGSTKVKISLILTRAYLYFRRPLHRRPGVGMVLTIMIQSCSK